jgi:hypothetical protein
MTLVLTCIGLVCKMSSSFSIVRVVSESFHVFSALKQKPTGRKERHGYHTCQARQGAGPPEIQNVLGEVLINYRGTTCFSINYVGILAMQLS